RQILAVVQGILVIARPFTGNLGAQGDGAVTCAGPEKGGALTSPDGVEQDQPVFVAKCWTLCLLLVRELIRMKLYGLGSTLLEEVRQRSSFPLGQTLGTSGASF